MISKTLKSIQTSVDLIKEYAEAKAFNNIQAEITALYKSLLDAQIQAFELQEELKLIKEKYIQSEDWKNETVPNYILAELAPSVFVYAFKPVVESAEPPHTLCAKCFVDQRKSILQRTRWDGLGIHYHCPECGDDILDHSKADTYSPPAVVKLRKSKWDGF
jgi:hypothetical protein